MHFLIDADSLMYKAGCSNETRYYTVCEECGFVVATFQYKKDALGYVAGDESLSIELCKDAGDLSHTLGNIKSLLTKVTNHPECTSYEVFIGGKNNFRYNLYPEYKANRDSMSIPIHLPEIKTYMQHAWNAIVVDGEEVDDRVSWEQCTNIKDITTCIVSIDKDLLNTPGWNYNYDKDVLQFIPIESANHNFYSQLIIGDRQTDNIPGLPGKGTGYLSKIDFSSHIGKSEKELFDIVYNEYVSAGYDIHYLTLNARLLWMRREPEQVWQPPT